MGEPCALGHPGTWQDLALPGCRGGTGQRSQPSCLSASASVGARVTQPSVDLSRRCSPRLGGLWAGHWGSPSPHRGLLRSGLLYLESLLADFGFWNFQWHKVVGMAAYSGMCDCLCVWGCLCVYVSMCV